MATPPQFLMPRQVPYAPQPAGLGAYGQQAYRLAGTPPQTQQRQYNLSGPLAPFAGPGGGGSSSGSDLAGLLGLLAQNPNALSGITNAAKGLLGGGTQAQFPGSMLDTAQKAGSLAELFPGAATPPMISPSAPAIGMNPAVDAAITQAGQGAGSAALPAAGAGTAAGGASAAAVPGSMLAAAQSGAPLSGLLAGTAPNLIAPSALTVGMNPAASAAITNAAAGQGAGLSGSLASLAGPAALIGGGLLAAQGISKGKEGQAALGGGIAGAGASLMGLGALGPLGLAGAALAALGASTVNTREFGDVALRNYWNAVDAGRGIGETDPNELAQGFINFYRTNKNEFPGQAKYGRTGNEEFMQDFKRTINSAIEQGTVTLNATPQEIHAKVIQPWIDTMGQGPQNAEARAIQDFMLQDLIASYQRGAPISNAEVKGDRKFAIVADPIRYPASPTPDMATMSTPAGLLDLSGDMIPVPPGEDVLAQYMGLLGGAR